MLLIYVWLLLNFLQTFTLAMDEHSSLTSITSQSYDSLQSYVETENHTFIDRESCIYTCYACLERCPIIGPICYRSWGDPNDPEHYNLMLYQGIESDRSFHACCFVMGSIMCCIPISIACVCTQ